ncbi:MAG TPA: GNAT family N-acetyltransferase [Acidimicrobiales bacterium]
MLPTPPEGLRHWRPDDAPSLEAAWSDPDIARWNPPPASLDAAAWIAGVDDRWARRLALDLVITPGVAGEVGLTGFTTDPARAELGVWVAPPHRRAGLATRAVRAVTTWALTELGLDQLWARTDPANTPAGALFDGLGWDRLGTSGGRTIWSATAALLR